MASASVAPSPPIAALPTAASPETQAGVSTVETITAHIQHTIDDAESAALIAQLLEQDAQEMSSGRYAESLQLKDITIPNADRKSVV